MIIIAVIVIICIIGVTVSIIFYNKYRRPAPGLPQPEQQPQNIAAQPEVVELQIVEGHQPSAPQLPEPKV